jgi:hypothetical protein
MTKYEKSILAILALGFVLLFFDFPGHKMLFKIAAFTLAASYFFWGIRLFGNRKRGDKEKIKRIFIIVGIVFSIALVGFLPMILRQRTLYADFLLVPNDLLCIFLAIYILVKRKAKIDLQLAKSIFMRSFVIVVLGSAFMYLPYSFKPFRKIIYAINKDKFMLRNELLLYDYMDNFDDAYEKGNCDAAIAYALKSEDVGLKSRNIPKSQEQGNPNLDDIEGVYTNLYDAYGCKAKSYFDNERYAEALKNYSTAHKYLTMYNMKSAFWRTQISWSLVDMANCYRNLREFKIADSLYVAAIKEYKSHTKKPTYITALLVDELAFSSSQQSYFANAINLYENSNKILIKEGTIKSQDELISNYNELATNYLKLDQLNKAFVSVKKAMALNGAKNSSAYCTSLFYLGACQYKLNDFKKAQSTFLADIDKYKKRKLPEAQDVAECYLILGYISMNTAEFPKAKKYLLKGMKITKKNRGSDGIRYGHFLLAYDSLNEMLGNYAEAEKGFNEILALYTANYGNADNSLTSVLAELSHVEVALSKFQLAKTHTSRALEIASGFSSLTRPNATSLLNKVGYVEYSNGNHGIAKSFYSRTIKINAEFSLGGNITDAEALNGLGLVATAQGNFVEADSLYSQALKLHQHIFGDINPLTANVYLNRANLFTKERKWAEANQDLQNALVINKRFFSADHDVFADILVVLGDIETGKGQKAVARGYYQKAITIYLKKFNEDHWKVIATRQKLK